MIGKILSTPVRIINAPLTAIESIFEDDLKVKDEDRIISAPLETFAKALDEIDSDDN